MLFGCPLPEELDGASTGQRAVFNAFEVLLSSAAEKDPYFLYEALCDAYKKQGDGIKLVKYRFMCLHAMFAHLTIHSQHSNWSRHGTHLSEMVVRELLITWSTHQVLGF
jgi:hypothetical protein